MINRWGVFWQTDKGVLGAGTARKKGGVLGAGPTGKTWVLGARQVKKRVFAAAHTYTGHIFQCPPPPPGSGAIRILNNRYFYCGFMRKAL